MRRNEIKNFYYQNELINYEKVREILNRDITNKDLNLLSEQLNSLNVEDFINHFFESDIQQNKIYIYDGKPLNLNLFADSLGVSVTHVKAMYKKSNFTDLKDLEIYLNNNKRSYEYKNKKTTISEFSSQMNVSNTYVSNLIRILHATTLDKVEEFLVYKNENVYNFTYNGENSHVKHLITKYKLKEIYKDISLTTLILLSMTYKTFNINEIIELINKECLKKVNYNNSTYTLKELCEITDSNLLVMISFMFGVYDIENVSEKLRYFRYRKKDNVYFYKGKQIELTLDKYLEPLGISLTTLYRLFKKLETSDIYDIETYLNKSKVDKLNSKLSKFTLNGVKVSKSYLVNNNYDLKQLERMRKKTGETDINNLLTLIKKDLENSYTYYGERMTVASLAKKLGVTRQYVSLVGVNLNTRKLELIEDYIINNRKVC